MKFIGATASALALAACSPALDWRELVIDQVHVSFPCKPKKLSRTLPLAGRPVTMTLHACDAEGATWAHASADVVDPALLDRALDELALAAQRNLQARDVATAAAAVPGMTPMASARRVQLEGRRPDGDAVRGETLVFARGTRVHQVTVIAPPGREAADTFFASVRVSNR